ncbi:MAG: PEP-CTERM sorting domain-containing protein [Myxococcales bacterium]|nr:PEP-CTERM sorting domain-containing protein [Myxococcales bacterium]
MTAVLLSSFAVANSASAYSYDYIDVDPVFEWVTADHSLSGTFDIMNPGSDCLLLICDSGGFDPLVQNVGAARIDFIFFDFGSGNEEIASITLGGELQEAIVNGDDRFLFVFYLEHFDANARVLAHLSDYGTLDWKVETPGADSFVTGSYTEHGDGKCDGHDHPPLLKYGILKASAAPIPEPTAAVLFCLGFGVVGAATRKRRMA